MVPMKTTIPFVMLNPTALRKAKTVYNFGLLSATGLNLKGKNLEL